MVYGDFMLSTVQAAFDLILEERQPLFASISGVPPSERLLTDITENKPLAIAINTEKRNF